MKTTGIKDGDIVQCDVRGDQFFGVVSQRHDRQIGVHALCRRTFRLVTARQIVGHYRKRKGSR